MGSYRWSPDDWVNYAKSTAGKPRTAVFKASGMPDEFNPRLVGVRESVDSDANPASTPIIVALDVTGSMGMIPEQLVKGNLGTLMGELLDRKPVADPHLMFMGVGDVESDRAPLQATQFEADIRIADQLERIYLEGGGGGNSHESYHLPWYFAATKTVCDSMVKRGRKGYLFTLGDEEPPQELLAGHIRAVFGTEATEDLSSEDVLAMAERSWHVFHIIVEEGQHCRRHSKAVKQAWNELLGQRVICLSDYTKLAEVIVSTIQMNEGGVRDVINKSWAKGTDVVVAHALAGLLGPGLNDGGMVVL